MIVATKLVCVTLIPFRNIYYQFKHTKKHLQSLMHLSMGGAGGGGPSGPRPILFAF